MARSAPKDRPDGGADQADSTAAGSTASAAAASRASSEASSPAKPPPAAPAASASPPSPDPAPTRSASVARDSPPEKAKPAKRMVATRVEPTEAAAAAPPPARGDAEPGAYVSLCAKFLELRLAELSEHVQADAAAPADGAAVAARQAVLARMEAAAEPVCHNFWAESPPAYHPLKYSEWQGRAVAPDLPALGGMLRALRGCEHLDAEGHNSLAAVLEGHLPYPVWEGKADDERGRGLFAKKDIPAGACVLSYVGEYVLEGAAETEAPAPRTPRAHLRARAAQAAATADAQAQRGEYGFGLEHPLFPAEAAGGVCEWRLLFQAAAAGRDLKQALKQGKAQGVDADVALFAWAGEELEGPLLRMTREAGEPGGGADVYAPRPQAWQEAPAKQGKAPVLYIEGRRRAGPARTVNHSCAPNLRAAEVLLPWGPPAILFFALRPILAGEELTLDYKPEGDAVKKAVAEEGNQIPCRCGAKNCRKWTIG